MSLTSFPFIAFFLVSLAVYYAVPERLRWCALFAFSALFMLLSSPLLPLLYWAAAVLAVNFCARQIAAGRAAGNGRRAKGALAAGILLTVGLLAALKYSGFLAANLNALLALLRVDYRLPIPAPASPPGVSFYTLTAVGYLLDSYWGISPVQPNLLKTALFIGYYPQLISGPITRYRQIEPQLFTPHRFDYVQVCFGLQRMVWGFFKKLVLSARLGILVDTIYAHPERYTGLYIWLAAALFLFQLYTDFSGCMDIVLGASECYGVLLPENFKTPFFSRSVQEYWQRWHITLGAWLRDYILYSLLRSRAWRGLTKWAKAHLGKKAARQLPTYLGTLCVWLLIGLWHGGGWQYILGMGLWFWLLITLSQLCEPLFKKALAFLKINTAGFAWHLFQSLRVFALAAVGNMFFRLQGLGAALETMRAGLHWNPEIFTDGSLLSLGLDLKNIWVLLLGLVLLLLVSWLQETKSIRQRLAEQPLPLRWAILLLLCLAVALFGMYGPEFNAATFIYEQF